MRPLAPPRRRAHYFRRIPEEWVKLGARVHGGFGSFIPVGIKIGEDAMKRLNAKPREPAVTY